MDFRHEIKYEINYSDMLVIRHRLGTVAYPDPHTIDGKYRIRSLYFDDPTDKALMDKLNGVSYREKFRIRYYNGDTSVIHLEKKTKISRLGNKQSAVLTAKQAQSIVDGDTAWMIGSDNALIRELYSRMETQRLAPKTIVDYTRLKETQTILDAMAEKLKNAGNTEEDVQPVVYYCSRIKSP